MEAQIGTAFIEESKNRANRARNRINHCLEQIEDKDLWWTPVDGVNSMGVIIQHLLGNLRQWVLSGVGGEADVRDRPSEFIAEETTSRSALRAQLDDLLDHVIATYSRLRPKELLEARTIQGFDASVLGAVYGTMTHLELHAGQIMYLSRLRLRQDYREYWKPATKEEGA